MSMSATPNNALARLCTLSLTLNTETRPGWLVLDGTTEYSRAAYPAFVSKFSAQVWFLAGSTSDKFKLLDIRDLAFVVAGHNVQVGAVTGASSVTLTSEHMPQHSHTYDKPSLGAAANIGVITQILGGILTQITIPKPIVTAGQSTGATGQAAPTPIPITPKSISVNVFVFAGLPQA